MKILVIIVKIVILQINSSIKEEEEVAVTKVVHTNQRVLRMMNQIVLVIQIAMIAHLLKLGLSHKKK